MVQNMKFLLSVYQRRNAWLMPKMLVLLVASFVLTACATPYTYQFQRLDDGAASDPATAGSAAVGCQMHDDADVSAELRADPTGEHAIFTTVTNKTDQVLKVEWTRVTMTRFDGLVTRLHPNTDLGWIDPSKQQSAQLIPFALPPSGSAALALDGKRFQLEIPMIVRRERKTYCYDWLAHVQETKE